MSDKLVIQVDLGGGTLIPVTTTMRVHYEPHIERTCGGFCAHEDGPAGETLIGWYKDLNEATTALTTKLEYKARARRAAGK